MRPSKLGLIASSTAVALAIVACGSAHPDVAVEAVPEGGAAPPTVNPNLDGGARAPATSEPFTPAGGEGGDAGACAGYDLCVSGLLSGPLSLALHVLLPKQPPQGAKAQFHLRRRAPSGGGATLTGFSVYDFAIGVKEPTPMPYVDVLVQNIQPDEYTAALGIDLDGDADAGSPGDSFGWCQGSVASPIFDEAKATPIVLKASAKVTFGIGTR